MSRRSDISRNPLLRTVSSEALLVDGSDATYRKMIHTLMAVGNSLDVLREGFAKVAGITGPQHELLMLIYRANDGNGLGVGELAGLVKLTSAFVATETNKLSVQGLIEKVPDTVDRRRVTLHVTDLGHKRLALLSKYQRQVNDTLFGCFQSKDFLKFAQYLDEILPCGEQAVRLLGQLVHEVEKPKKTRSAGALQ